MSLYSSKAGMASQSVKAVTPSVRSNSEACSLRRTNTSTSSGPQTPCSKAPCKMAPPIEPTPISSIFCMATS